MIQRIQTVYLFLGALCVGLMFVFDVCRFRVGEMAHYLGLMEITNPEGTATSASQNMAVLILVPLVAAVMIFNISQFKRRDLQLKLSRLSFLLLAGLVVAMYFFITSNQESIPVESVVGYGFGSAAPIGALVFNFLALRGIHKDEKLVKSLDRLR
jgi:glucan phosphoethanolaminetransferase (alkaline phosphatase superfamily)